ncbi:MAG TPA: peptidoglycan DD-metalloendopeptidase family protein [Candidatus Agathobaculum intestinipullorum]|nr:peptidoglycan DD-metalloendopeptidase family protein [Candidatus Agathobaculum intestinipullorum]
MGKYVWPCPKYSWVSSGYGNRVHPISGQIKFHDGIDLAAASGTPILAFGPGTVTMSGWNGGYGNYISIDHGGGLMSFYGHCSALYVKKGATVKAGQKIAAVGTTGSSTGNHLHFGMHKNGSPVNPQSYVKDSDTTANYTGSGGSGTATNTVKAMFTAYYPADNAIEGGFLDAQGNLLDPAKRTCAAPPSVAFGTKMTVQGTGTSLDGVTYTVNDRGGAIQIENGVYHFDLLMSSNEECNNWGVRYGTAILGGDGASGSADQEEPKSKPITKVVVKSVTGAAGTRKEDLRQLPAYQQAGVELTIQNNYNQMQNPVLEGDVVWETQRSGMPASLKFTVVKDEILDFHEGNPVSFRFNGANVFYGYVFRKSRSDSLLIDVTCYDQTRYFKNKDTISYENKTYAELVKMLAADYGLTVGTLVDTKYKIPQRIEEGTIFDIFGNASDLTVINTGRVYNLFDDFGKLTLKAYADMLLPIYIDEDTAQDYSYTSSIDSDVYNRIKLAYDNGDTGEREVHVLNDTTSQAKWGVLQYYAKLDSALSTADLQAKAKALLQYYNVIRRELTMKKVFGDVRARAGASVAVGMGLGDINIRNYMCIEKAKHTFSHGLHTMDLYLSGVRGEFSA